MRLIFVRHGEPDYANDCLTANGRVQAECTSKRLAGEKIKAVYASPMGRAVETASYTAKVHGLEVQKLDFMHEIGWGDKALVKPEKDKAEGENAGPVAVGEAADTARIPYEGHPWTLAYKLLSENPEYVGSSAWKDHPYFKDNLCMDYFDRIFEGIDGLFSQYGYERRGGIYYCKEKCDDTIALFAHGGSGAIMFSHILSLPFTHVLTTLPYGVCSVTVFALDGEVGEAVIPRFELFNDMTHLEAVKKELLHFEM